MRVARLLAAVSTLIAAAAVVYRPALSAYFFDDDFQWLVGSWSFHPARLVAFADMNHFYRPVIDAYFGIATPAFGGSPVLFHLANVVLHAANGLLVFAFANRISGNLDFGFLSALFFVVQPAHIDAVAWVGAIGEPLSVCFGLIALLGLLELRRTGRRRWHLLSVTAFLLALLTHESAVMFLPLLVLTAYFFAREDPLKARGQAWRWARPFVPYALVAAAYLAIDLWINSRNYVVSDGHYAIGRHVASNALDYVVALYVGRRDAANYVLIAVGLPLLLLRGSPRARFAACWTVLAMAPFVFFTWGNASRYLYFPAIGFAMLLSEGVLSLGRLPALERHQRLRVATIALLAGAVAVRFMVFAVHNVEDFAARTETYRRGGQLFRQVHGRLPRHSRVQLDSRLQFDHEPRFVTAMIQWEYGDPTIELIVTEESRDLRQERHE